MPRMNLRPIGFGLTFTAKIPVEAQEVLQKKSDDALASFGLTPAWGNVPSLKVKALRRAKVDVPEHWLDSNEVYPIEHGFAFYIVPEFGDGWAATFTMKGVNIRTGMKEEMVLVDDPCQSYWGKCVPWIDGYVPSHGQAVRQFVPLRGEEEMIADVSKFAGVAEDDAWRDGISAGFYLPVDLERLEPIFGGMLGNPNNFGISESVFESMYVGASKGGPSRGGLESYQVEAVGIGAGALMRQKHQDDPTLNAGMFNTQFLRLTSRIVWTDQWNSWARAIGEEPLGSNRLDQLLRRQEEYERGLWQQLGGKPKKTFVDSLPKIK